VTVSDTYARFAEARACGPVHPSGSASLQEVPATLLFGFAAHHPCVTVLGHAEVSAVLKDRESYGQGGYGPNLERALGPTVLSMEEPEHRRYRALILEALHKREMPRWERDYVDPVVTEALDVIAPCGRADLVTDLALAVAPRVIARALGLPGDDVARFLAWGRAMLNFVADPRAGAAAASAIGEYCRALVADRRRGGGTDLISRLACVELDGDRLSDADIASFVKLLIPAGSDTTFRATSNLFAGLLTHPEQLELLRSEPDRVGDAVEEGLRWEPPMQIIPRQARVAGAIGDVPVPAGALVEIGIGPANRDAARWEHPAVFDITRPPRPHLAFGLGNHTCVGLHLARLEITRTVSEALRRLPGLRLDPGAGALDVAIRGLGFRCPARLPVVFDPA
jgi:cytochrome P450